MLATRAGLRSLTVASIILLDWAFVRGLASLRAHPSLLVLSARPLHRSRLLFD